MMRAYFFLFLLLSQAFAQELDSFIGSNIDPLRTVDQVHEKSVAEEVFRLKGAKVAIADYDLIRRDFPDIRKFTNQEIDNWLLEQTAYISHDQKAQTSVNSFIETVEGKNRKAYRPPEYGRALVYEVSAENKALGVIDVKGAGGVLPSHASHRSGTMTLGESLREFSYEKLVTNVVDHSGIENKVVGAYAVIDPGFDVIHENGSRSRGGLYLRQGHKRLTYAESGFTRGNGWMDDTWRGRYEKLLDRYGIWANKNYQGTVKNDLFDFGHYIVRQDLPGATERIAIPFEQWGFEKAADEPVASTADRWKFSKQDRPWVWAHDTAEAFAKGEANRHHVWMHHYNMLRPVQEKLEKTPRLYDFAAGLGFKVKFCQQVFDIQGR